MSIKETVVDVGLTLADIDALLAGDEPQQRDGPKCYSMDELMRSTGNCHSVLKKRLRRLKEVGKLTVVLEQREGIDGRMHPVPVYVIG